MIRCNEDDTSQWQIAGAKRKRKSSNPNAPTSDGQPACEDWELQVRIKFIGRSVSEFLYRDAPTILHLLKKSIFQGKFHGKGKLNYDQYCMFLQITDERYIPDLLKITELREGDISWPIEVTKAFLPPKFVYGVIKLDPMIPIARIQEEIARNSEINANTHGAKIDEVFRIKKRVGPGSQGLVPTWSVRLRFEGVERPDQITHGDACITVSTYYPTLIICSKCSKYGHTARKCTRAPCCGFCSKRHEKNTCSLKPKEESDKNKTKCPNCGDTHTAKYRGCTRAKIERDTIIEHAETQVPKQAIRKRLFSEVAMGMAPTYNPLSTKRNPRRPWGPPSVVPQQTQPTPRPEDFPQVQRKPVAQQPTHTPSTPPTPPISQTHTKTNLSEKAIMDKVTTMIKTLEQMISRVEKSINDRFDELVNRFTEILDKQANLEDMMYDDDEYGQCINIVDGPDGEEMVVQEPKAQGRASYSGSSSTIVRTGVTASAVAGPSKDKVLRALVGGK